MPQKPSCEGQVETVQTLNGEKEKCAQGEAKVASRMTQEWQRIFDTTETAIWFLDQEQRVVYSNKSADRFFKRSEKEIIGRYCWELAHGFTQPISECPCIRAKNTLRREIMELQVGELWFEVIVDPLLDEAGQFAGAIHVVSDITRRKRTEEALKRSEERYRLLVENIKFGITLIGSDYRVITTNTGQKNLFNKPASEMEGKHCFQEFEKRSEVCPHCPGTIAMKTGKPAEVVTKGIRDDGSRMLVHIHAFPMFGQQGEPSGFIELIEDITARSKMEDDLRESKMKIRGVLDHTLEFIALLKSDGTLIEVNRTALDFIGVEAAQVVEKPFWETPWWTHSAEMQQRLRKAVNAACRGEIDRFEATHPAADGSMHYVDFSLKPVMDDAENVSFLLATAYDITERKRKEDAVREGEEFLSSIIENIPNMIFIKDAEELRFVRFNKAGEELLGYKRADLIGKNDYHFFSKEQADFFTKKDREVLRSGKLQDMPEEPIDTKGGRRILHTKKIPIPDGNGKPAYLLGISEDITERKRVEESLRRSEEENATLNEIANIFLTASDEAMYEEVMGVILRVTRSAYGIFGFIGDWRELNILSWSRKVWEECQVSDKTTVFPPDAWRESIWGRAVKDKKSFYSNGPFHTPEGHIHLDNCLAVPIIFGEQTIGLLCVANKRKNYDEEDKKLLERIALKISPILQARLERDRLEKKRKHAVDVLRRSEEQYRSVIENINLGITLIGTDYRIIMTNSEMGRIHNKPPHKFEGKYCFRELEKRSEVCPHCPGRIAMATGKPAEVEVTGFRDDGSAIPGRIRAVPSFGQRGEIKGFIEVVEDLTERKQVEKELQKHENKYQDIYQKFTSLFDAISDSVNILSSDLKLLWVNRPLKSLTNKNSSDLIGQYCYNVFYGRTEPCEGCLVLRCFKSKKQEFSEITTPDGECWDLSASPVIDDHGEIKNVIELARNITSKKQAEQKMMVLHDQLQQSQKMEAVGRLAGGVAHDFNNLLTVIQGNCELSLFALRKEDPLRGNLESIEKAAHRASDLTRQLLAFSRRQVAVMQVVNLNKILTDLEKILQRVIGEHIEFRTILADDLGMVKVDPGQMEQVVMNLAVNARDAMPGGGKLFIETANVSVGQENSQPFGEMFSGEYVKLQVRDTGTGMSKEVKQQIFDPFFTTKAKGKGTGLGLSMAYGIIKQSGGEISVDSAEGEGATFSIYLPRVYGNAEEPGAEKGYNHVPRGTETILVVEDEEMVRDLTTGFLRNQGYTVLEASNGEEALEMVKHEQRAIDLVLTDVVMPKMNGVQLIGQLKEREKDFSVLYMSGYTDEAIIQNEIVGKGAELIHKPFSFDELAIKVREVLDKS